MDNGVCLNDPFLMDMCITHPHLKFRFWCEVAGTYVADYCYNGAVEDLFQGDTILEAQQCTGLRDAEGRWVYEGDVVEILIERNMPFWEGGGAVGGGIANRLTGAKLVAEVSRDPCCPCNLYLSGHLEGLELHLPVSWVKKGVVLPKAVNYPTSAI